MTAAQIFRSYVRFIGVGAIATAGIFGIIKSLRIVAGSFGIAARAFRRGESARASAPTATSPIMTILVGVVVGAIGVGDLLRHARRRRRCRPPDRPGADAGLLVLLHLGRRQRHRHHRAQSRSRA